MFTTLMQEKAKSALKAALLDVLLAHQSDDGPSADSVTAAVQVTYEGVVGQFEVAYMVGEEDMPLGGGSL